MKRSAAQVGSVRRVLASLLALGLFASPALAGDRALLELIGYSEDGQYFAFEEFGITDGAGFAYSTIFVVNLAEDSWVVGTPIREQADDEDTSLAAVREDARAAAADEMDKLKITVPAQMVALIGDGEPDDTAQSLRFGLPGYTAGAVSGDYRLALDTYPTASAAPCDEWFSWYEPLGFALTLVDGETTTELHRDDSLPRSRGCPEAYRLYGVSLPAEAQDLAGAVALVSFYPGGFEGPDRRFLAVPFAP